VAKIAAAELRRLAAVGARARMVELKSEIAGLVKAFPELARGSTAISGVVATVAKRTKPGRKTPMSKAERQEVSRRMKKYWAARRAEKNGKK
jgi:hypothetical protein